MNDFQNKLIKQYDSLEYLLFGNQSHMNVMQSVCVPDKNLCKYYRVLCDWFFEHHVEDATEESRRALEVKLVTDYECDLKTAQEIFAILVPWYDKFDSLVPELERIFVHDADYKGHMPKSGSDSVKFLQLMYLFTIGVASPSSTAIENIMKLHVDAFTELKSTTPDWKYVALAFYTDNFVMLCRNREIEVFNELIRRVEEK